MPRKVDINQPAIMQGLRQCGAIVHCTHEVGKGFPDLCVSFRGVIHLIELKTPGKGSSLTDDEFAFHQRWHADGAPVHVCETLHEALHAIGALQQEPTP